MNEPLKNIESLVFCDESKFYINDGNFEDAIYYFGVSVTKNKVAQVNAEIEECKKKNRIKSTVFHSTTIFKNKRPRSAFMNELTQIFIKHRLICFCHKYPKELLFEPTKYLNKFNNDIIDFEKSEFQALFYFLIMLNTYLRDERPNLLKKEIAMYFDRNVYGINEVEAFEFPSKDFVLKQMTFSEKSLISLLSLPDFFGYIFRKSKISQNKFQSGDRAIEKSELVINSYKCLLEINNAGLFNFLDIDNTLERSLKNL